MNPALFVTGAIGSGKSYASSRLAKLLNIKLVSLDHIYFDMDSAIHRQVRPEAERMALLGSYLQSGPCLCEGWHFGTWLHPLYQCCLHCIIIDETLDVRERRIKERHALRQSGLLDNPFPQGGEQHLQKLLEWTKRFIPDDTAAEVKSHAPAHCQFHKTTSDLCDLPIDAIRSSMMKTGH